MSPLSDKPLSNKSAPDAAGHMDQMYRYQRHIYDLTRRHYLLGRKTLIAGLAPPAGGTILEVGCGTASNLVEAAQRFPKARLYGFDISAEMLKSAEQSVARKNLTPRVTLNRGDATAFDGQALFGVPAFDRIFASYTLSMIPDWPEVIERMLAQAATGGSVHIVDFGDCKGLPAVAKSALYGWLKKFDVTPRQNLEAVLQALAAKRGFKLDYRPLHRGYAQYAVLKRG